jgi:hypothetical protein
LSAPQAALYVSPDGNDAWSGRLPAPNAERTDGPLATLARARDLARQLKGQNAAAQGIAVNIRGGRYILEQTLDLTAEDSGTAEAPVVYQAYENEPVSLSGGREVTAWSPVTDPNVLERLSPQARGQVYQADLKAQGIKDYGTLRSRGFRPTEIAALELFFNDKPMTLARWPNDDFSVIAGIPERTLTKDAFGADLGPLDVGFHYSGDRPRQWKDLHDIWVHGYWAYDWANSYERIESIDLDNHLIKPAAPHGLYGFRKGQRIYFLNILEELDSPGEWYMDRSSGILYFWPPEGLDGARATVSVIESPLISLRGASHVRIRGLTLEYTRGSAMAIEGGEDNRVQYCLIRNIGNNGVVIEGGRSHAVEDCEICSTGDGGVKVSGGDRKTLTPSGHRVYNNHIHHIGRWSKCYVPAVFAGGVGVTVSHNLIHDHPHCAVLFNGNEHVIEYNEIHDVCLETGDVGAIYTGRDYTYGGNIIRYNYLHHTAGAGLGSNGVYMDDCSGNAAIYGNLFYKVPRAIFIGGGRNNEVTNNVFVGCSPAVYIDSRGLDPSPVWHDMVYKALKQRLEDMNWRNPPYSTRYPKLAELEKYYATDKGVPTEGTIVERNICVGGRWMNITWLAKPEMLTIRDNLVNVDPLFVDVAGEDFHLRPDSPAFKLGFQALPLEQIGPVKEKP